MTSVCWKIIECLGFTDYNFFLSFASDRMIATIYTCQTPQPQLASSFSQWDGDLNEIKARVKESIEDMAAQWSQEEKDQCVAGTADAFKYGGGINAYLSGGRSGH